MEAAGAAPRMRNGVVRGFRESEGQSVAIVAGATLGCQREVVIASTIMWRNRCEVDLADVPDVVRNYM